MKPDRPRRSLAKTTEARPPRAALRLPEPSISPGAVPRRPRLKPFVTVVPVREDYVLLHGPNLFLRISDDGVPLFNRLLPLLDGSNDYEEILRRSGAKESELQEVLVTLTAQGIIEDASLETPLSIGKAQREFLGPQRTIFSHFTHDANLAQSRLLAADVLILGCGPVGAAAAEVLQAAGVGRIALADSRDSKPWDRHVVGRASANGNRSRALAQSLAAPLGLSRAQAVDSPTTDFRRFDSDELQRLVKGRAHVLVALESPDSTLLAAVNEACLKQDVPWTPAELYGPVAHIGPTVLPRKGACWRCYDLRRKGAQPGLDRFLMYEKHREAQPDVGEPREGLLPSFAPVAGSIAAQEAMTSIARFTQPALLGRVLVFDFITWTSQRHRVLRLPRCPACGAAEIADLDRFDMEPVYL